jgi:hypothetical protein
MPMGRRPLPAVRDLTHDGGWNTFDKKNVLKMSKVSFLGVLRTLQSNINKYSPPPPPPPVCSSPLVIEYLPTYPASGIHL